MQICVSALRHVFTELTARHAGGDSSGVLDEQALDVVTEFGASGDPDAGSLARVAALRLCRYQAAAIRHRAPRVVDAVSGVGQLAAVVKNRLKRVQYRPSFYKGNERIVVLPA